MGNKYIYIVMAILLAVVLWLYYGRDWLAESFDSQGLEFVPVGSDRYGLRGDLLRRRPITDYYISPDRQMRLHPSSGLMYISNRSPSAEGTPNCQKVECPTNTNEYDNRDSCWMCGDNCQTKMRIPDIWSRD